jgi:uncharacterized protein (DUF305 family)
MTHRLIRSAALALAAVTSAAVLVACGGDDDAAQPAGAKFDRMFLALMIEHHRGALLMAKTEGAQGKNQEALSLAERMKAAQAAEIKKMQRMKKA